MVDRLITVAIHTYDRALELKSLLESEGITVSLQNVNLDHPIVASGVRVRIMERDLPLALRIIENAEIFSNPKISADSTRTKSPIIVPVDFSDYSRRACDFAFHLAMSHKTSITILHSYVNPNISNSLQLTDTLSYDIANTENYECFEQEAHRQMDRFIADIRNNIKEGLLPPVKFNFEIAEGIPEDVINQYAKDHNPQLIVMGTRGTDTKERELVGSVTAEVLDTCRYPVFTIPESVNISSDADINYAVFFSNLDQEDILALDSLHRLLPDRHLTVTLVNIPSKKQPSNVDGPINALLKYCSEHYVDYDFNLEKLNLKSLDDDYKRISKNHVDLIVVPNKRKNIFARLFNPGIAHRLLFHSDIAMMVIPV